jgi:hypothetical protein
MDRRINHVLNILLTISFLIVFTAGVIKFPGFLRTIGLTAMELPMAQISTVHDWAGISMGILVFVTLAPRWVSFFRRGK